MVYNSGSIWFDSNLECPRIDGWDKFKNILESVQELINNEFILSGHDKK